MPYLVETKMFAIEEINDRIYPAYIYAFFFFSAMSGPVSAKFGSLAVIRVGVLCELIVRVILIFGESVRAMQAMEVLFAMTIASFPFAFSYALEIVRGGTSSGGSVVGGSSGSGDGDDEVHNGDVTGYVSAVFAFSYGLAAIVGQFIVDYGRRGTKRENVEDLFWVSLFSVLIAVCVAFFGLEDLGSARRRKLRKFRDRNNNNDTIDNNVAVSNTKLKSSKSTFGLRESAVEVMETIKLAYGTLGARCLSIWWIIASAGLNFVQTYGSNSWYESDSSSGRNNGYFVFLSQASIALVSLLTRFRSLSEDYGNRPRFYSICSLFGFVSAVLTVRWGHDALQVGGSEVIPMFSFYVILTSAVNLGLLVNYARVTACISNGFEKAREEEMTNSSSMSSPPAGALAVANSEEEDDDADDDEIALTSSSFSMTKEKAAIRMIFGMNSVFSAFALVMFEAITHGHSAKGLVRLGAIFIQVGSLLTAITTRLCGLKNGFTFSLTHLREIELQNVNQNVRS